MNYRHEVGIYTGANDAHFGYLTCLLNSLSVYNDARIPVCILDFGLNAENKARIRAGWPQAEIVDCGFFAEELAPVKAIPGASRYGWFTYIYRTYFKLCMAKLDFAEYFLWLDADCLLLTDIGRVLPEKVPGRLHAGRNGRQPMSAQFIDEHHIIREALAEHLLRHNNVGDYPHHCYNSGVLFVQHAYYAQLYHDCRDPILYKYGSQLYGDQALINIAVMLRKDPAIDLRRSINLSISAQTKTVETHRVRHNGAEAMGITVDGVTAEVYHFLHYKPHEGTRPGHPVQELYEYWLHRQAG